MNDDRIAETIASAICTIFFSVVTAYDIHVAINADGFIQVVYFALAVFMSFFASHFAKIMLEGEK